MANTSFTTKFDLTLAPKQFVLVDTFDYVAAGIALSDVNGVFQIVAPSGSVIYDNTDYSDSGCNIQNSVSRTNKVAISLPLDSSTGLPELGTYTITYSVYDKNLAVYYTQVNTYDNEYSAPIVDITQDVNIIAPLFSQTDITDYVVNGITPTLSRLNKLTYPAGVSGGAPAPVTTTAATLRTTVFFNGTQTSTVTSAVTYTFADGLVISDSLFGSKEILVDGTYYCSIACSLKDYAKKVSSCDEKLRAIYEENYKLACSYMTTIMILVECNGGSDISWLLDKVTDILGECGCGCDGDTDDDFARITGWGSLVGADGAPGSNGTNGTNGTNGVDGASGVAVLNNNVVVDSTSSGAYASLKSYTVAADQLHTDGDALEVTSIIIASGTTAVKNVKMLFGGVDLMPKLSALGYLKMQQGEIQMLIKTTITRSSDTTLFVKHEATQSSGAPFYGATSLYSFYEPLVTLTSLLTSNSHLLDVKGNTTAPDTIVCKQLMVTYLKKIIIT